jgi:hypothetical protein
MGLYYDDPKTTDESELRSEVGSLIDEVQAGVIDYAKYNVKTIGIDEYVVVSMPFVNTLSYFIGVIRAYPVLTKYTAEHGYSSADYSIELYMPDKTLYMFPIVK